MKQIPTNKENIPQMHLYQYHTLIPPLLISGWKGISHLSKSECLDGFCLTHSDIVEQNTQSQKLKNIKKGIGVYLVRGKGLNGSGNSCSSSFGSPTQFPVAMQPHMRGTFHWNAGGWQGYRPKTTYLVRPNNGGPLNSVHEAKGRGTENQCLVLCGTPIAISSFCVLLESSPS